jgi:Tol biopolymer transport system component
MSPPVSGASDRGRLARDGLRLLAAAVCAASVAAVAAAGHATPPGANGRIVFERLRFQGGPTWGELFVMNADGSGVRKLTHPPAGTEDTNADWSPDGSRIVFARAPSVGAHSIWTVRPDGTGLRRLTPPCPPGAGIPRCPADDGWPVWSPDGTHIAFQRLAGALRPRGATVDTAKRIYRDQLVVTDPDGRHARVLVWFGRWRGDPQIPVWSPDGKRVAFLEKSDNGGGCSCRALYVVNADGTGLRRVTPSTVAPGDKIDWSPDGRAILFRTHPGEDLNGSSGLGANLYTIHPDGTGLRQLTHFAPDDRVDSGSYSPDGRFVVFETSAGALGGTLPDVFVMHSDGTGLRRITSTRNFETQADWGPA